MIGNAAPPPSNEPDEPPIWKDWVKLVFVGLLFVAACVALVVGVIANILGFI